MSTIELRHVITEYLTHIDDASFLNALKTIIESKVAEGTYKLSDLQKKRIDAGREQVKKGQTISHESLNNEIDQWLGTK
jgi:predicted transcriptional regulator